MDKLQLLRKVKIELMNAHKEKFIIPTPEKDETEDKYISRCISSIIDEYGRETASAICYSNWEKK